MEDPRPDRTADPERDGEPPDFESLTDSEDVVRGGRTRDAHRFDNACRFRVIDGDDADVEISCLCAGRVGDTGSRCGDVSEVDFGETRVLA